MPVTLTDRQAHECADVLRAMLAYESLRPILRLAGTQAMLAALIEALSAAEKAAA